MFNNERPPFETWIFDFDEDIYGQTLEVALLGSVRGQEKFKGLDELIAAVNHDATQARLPPPGHARRCPSWTKSSAFFR